MGLLDEIASEPSRRSGKTCTVTLILESLNEKDRADLQQAIDDLLINGTNISRVLERRGINLPPSAIGRHRRGDCICD